MSREGQHACNLPLEPGEQVVMTADTAPLYWLIVCACAIGFVLVVPLIAAVYLLSRSGRFCLTTRRLICKPRWGKPRTLRLSALDLGTIRAGGVAMRLSVRELGAHPLSLLGVRRLDRLWGGLVLFSKWPISDCAATPDRKATRGYPATLSERLSYVHGVVLHYPDRLLFLPRGTSADAGQLAGDLALSLIGIGTVRVQASLPWERWLPLAASSMGAQFEALVAQIAGARGSWESWSVLDERPSRTVRLRRGEQALAIHFDRDELAAEFRSALGRQRAVVG